MRFKSDSQRKAVMARLTAQGLINKRMSPRIRNIIINSPSVQKDNPQELKKKGVFIKHQADSDKDGVVNIKDCKPLNPKQHGILHDWKMNLLKKHEQKLERNRIKEQKDLDAVREKLESKRKIAASKVHAEQSRFAVKQAKIDEINEERRKLKELKDEGKRLKRESRGMTKTGKVVAWLGKSLKATGQTIGSGLARGTKAAVEYERKHGKAQFESMRKGIRKFQKMEKPFQ